MTATASGLHLGSAEFQVLLAQLGPSLGVWRAAEIAALRTQVYEPPVLDLGCGDGLVTSFVLAQVDIGVDPCSAAIDRAAGRNLYRRLETRPVEAVDIAPGSIGTVISNSVLEHIGDIEAVLRTTARLLRPAGRLIFTVPTDAFSRWLALPLPAYRAWRNRHYEHRNIWPIERWQTQLDRCGFTLTLVQPYLRREIVTAWDVLELLQRVQVGRYRLFGLCWRRLPYSALARLAQRAARADLSAPAPGGGRLMVARRR